jgi:hypothetical protein
MNKGVLYNYIVKTKNLYEWGAFIVVDEPFKTNAIKQIKEKYGENVIIEKLIQIKGIKKKNNFDVMRMVEKKKEEYGK